MKRWPIFTFVGAALAFGLLAGWWLRGQSDLDACLDAGGKWEAQGGYCMGTYNRSAEL